MPVAKPDRQLTQGQYKTILRTLGRVKRGKKPQSGRDFAEMLYQVSDYYDNVSKTDDYDHGRYMQYLFENRDVPRELLELVPKVKY